MNYDGEHNEASTPRLSVTDTLLGTPDLAYPSNRSELSADTSASADRIPQVLPTPP